MMWKILIGLDIAFSSLAIVTAGVLGNSLIANHIPRLHDNSTWLSRLVMTGLTAPDAVADWALGALPTISILLSFMVLVAAESLLLLLTPLVDRALAAGAAQKYQQDLRSTYHEVLRNRGQVRSLKRRILRRVILRLSAISLLAFTVSLAAGAIAWGVALLINASTGGVIQTFAIVTSIVALLLMYDVLKEIVPSVVEDDNDGLARVGELPRDSALPLRRKVQRPWRVVALAVFIVGSTVVASRLAQRQQETPVQEIEAPISVSQSTPANSFLEPITGPLNAGVQPAPTILSLGSFSDGSVQLEFWRDESANGELLGRISIFSQDVSKNPKIGELASIRCTVANGALSFTSKLRGEVVSFDGIATRDAIQGKLHSSTDEQPFNLDLRRGEKQYEKNYSSRLEWSKEMAEQLACCGPNSTE